MQAFQHLSPDCTVTDSGREVLDDLEVDVSFQEAKTHLAHGFRDIGFSQRAFGEKTLEDIL